MAATWAIGSLERTFKLGSKSNVVTQIHWNCEDSTTVGEDTYSGSVYGTQPLDTSNLSGFVAYTKVTEEVALGWLMDAEEEQWIDFVNCHGEIRNGSAIADSFKKYNIQPFLFIQLQNKLSKEQHINQKDLYTYIFDSNDTKDLQTMLEVIRSQRIEGVTQNIGDRIEEELKRRKTDA